MDTHRVNSIKGAILASGLSGLMQLGHRSPTLVLGAVLVGGWWVLGGGCWLVSGADVKKKLTCPQWNLTLTGLNKRADF